MVNLAADDTKGPDLDASLPRLLAPEQLRVTCDLSALSVGPLRPITPGSSIIGQPRATAALEFGLGMTEQGYNIVVTGPPGIGKMTALKTYLADIARPRPSGQDLCYVENFGDPEHPQALILPAGCGRQFTSDLARLVRIAQQQVPRAFESDVYTLQVEALQKALETEREDRFSALNTHARAAGFVLQTAPMGIGLIPVVDGKPMTEEQFEALTPAERQTLQETRARLDDEIGQMMKALRERERAAREQVEQLERDVALHAVGGLIDDLIEDCAEMPQVTNYLTELREDMVAHVTLFRALAEVRAGDGQPNPFADPVQIRKQALRRYTVNVVVDRSGATGAPVIIESFPIHQNLIGRIEKEPQLGTLITDFTMIRAGSLHRANGGYLVIEASDLLAQPFAWDALKRSLRTAQISIEEPADLMGASAVRTLRPAPVPLTVKVILVGDRALLDLLLAVDPSVAELFRVRADFDVSIARTRENEQELIAFIRHVAAEGQFAPLDPSALAKLIEHASRLAEDQTRLSVQLGPISDVIAQANYWAGRANAPAITAAHVTEALDQIVYRSSLIEERLREMMQRGTLMVDTSGAVVGQINGLAVEAIGDHSFGLPIRITASVGVGREGIVDVERAAHLGGPTHSKGVLILSGFLTEHFARNRPLSLAARLTVEQSYGGIEGDSASSAELYALLSSLADAPIAQHFAVTGSVNQKGQIQAIGGVNEKVEGFFALCKARGLTGEQGVLIPTANVPNLMLREKVVEAARAGQFHIHAVATISEGIALLTGVPAGAPDETGAYPAGTIYGRIEARLRTMAESLAELATGKAEPRLNGQIRQG